MNKLMHFWTPFLMVLFFSCCNCRLDSFELLYGNTYLNTNFVTIIGFEKRDSLYMISSDAISNIVYEISSQRQKLEYYCKLKRHKLSYERIMGYPEKISEPYEFSYTIFVNPDTIFYGNEKMFLNYCFQMQNKNYVLIFDGSRGNYFFLDKNSAIIEIQKRKEIINLYRRY